MEILEIKKFKTWDEKQHEINKKNIKLLEQAVIIKAKRKAQDLTERTGINSRILQQTKVIDAFKVQDLQECYLKISKLLWQLFTDLYNNKYYVGNDETQINMQQRNDIIKYMIDNKERSGIDDKCDKIFKNTMVNLNLISENELSFLDILHSLRVLNDKFVSDFYDGIALSEKERNLIINFNLEQEAEAKAEAIRQEERARQEQADLEFALSLNATIEKTDLTQAEEDISVTTQGTEEAEEKKKKLKKKSYVLKVIKEKTLKLFLKCYWMKLIKKEKILDFLNMKQIIKIYR